MAQSQAKTGVMYETGQGEPKFVYVNARRTTVAISAHAQQQIRQKIAEANSAKTWSICQNLTSKRKQVM